MDFRSPNHQAQTPPPPAPYAPPPIFSRQAQTHAPKNWRSNFDEKWQDSEFSLFGGPSPNTPVTGFPEQEKPLIKEPKAKPKEPKVEGIIPYRKLASANPL